MLYVYLLLFMGIIFLLCFGVDQLFGKIIPKDSRKAVRQRRRTVTFGVLLTFFGFVILLGFWVQLSWYLRAGCGIVMLMGAFLLLQYFAFAIRYNETGFSYKALGKKGFSCTYGEILGQTSLLTRSGVNSTLYTKKGEVHIYSSLEGLNEFLKTAFAHWCEETGTDPERVENSPQYLTYFPEMK